MQILIALLLMLVGCGQANDDTAVGQAQAQPRISDALAQELGWVTTKRAAKTALPGAVEKVSDDAFYRVEFGEYDVPESLLAATRVKVQIELANAGNSTWEAQKSVGLSYHWYSSNGDMIALNGQRTELPTDIAPGESVMISAGLQAPTMPGSYILSWDLVRQGVSWFSGKGGDTLDLAIDVPANAGQYIGGPEMATTRTRLLMIGIDGGDWNVFDPLLEAGRLPNLSKLIERGVRADLMSLEDFSASPVIWTSIATGRPPEEHGVTDFTIYDAASRKTVPVNSGFRRVSTFWDQLGMHDISTGVVGWWATWPTTPIYGLMVSDRFAMYPQVDRATSPPMLKQELVDGGITSPKRHSPLIQENLGRYVDLNSGEADATLHPRLQMNFNQGWLYYKHDQVYLDASLYLIEKYHPEMFATYFRGVDALQHFFWQYVEPEKFDVPEEEVELFREILPTYAEYVDQGIGRLLAAVPDDTTVLIVSDHGAQAASGVPTIIATNRFLEKLGLLTFDGEMVDFSKTQAFVDMTRGDVVGIRVNLQGREPHGIVPPENLAAVIADIERRVESLSIIGDAPVRSPLRPKARDGDAWDVMYAWNSYKTLKDDTEIDVPDGERFQMGEIAILQYRSGKHRREGIFLLAGPGVRRGEILEHASVFDILPTLTYIMDSPIPSDLTGRILKDAFTEPYAVARQERYFVPEDGGRLDGEAPVEEVDVQGFDNQILQDLRALGYIE